jgi:hypothetical protein
MRHPRPTSSARTTRAPHLNVAAGRLQTRRLSPVGTAWPESHDNAVREVRLPEDAARPAPYTPDDALPRLLKATGLLCLILGGGNVHAERCDGWFFSTPLTTDDILLRYRQNYCIPASLP